MRLVPIRTPNPLFNRRQQSLCATDSETDDWFDPRVLAPIDADDFSYDDNTPAHHLRRDIIPIYEVNRSISSHYLKNFHYDVIWRPERYSDIRTNAMIAHIIASTNRPSVSLLYPEAQFSCIFWSESSDAPVSANPSFLLSTTEPVRFGRSVTLGSSLHMYHGWGHSHFAREHVLALSVPYQTEHVHDMRTIEIGFQTRLGNLRGNNCVWSIR